MAETYDYRKGRVLTPQVEPEPVEYEPPPAAPFVPQQPYQPPQQAYAPYEPPAASSPYVPQGGVPPPSSVPPTVPTAPTAPPPSVAPTVDQWGNPVGSQQAGIDAFWNAATVEKRRTFTPAQLQGWGVTQLSADKYRLPNGQVVDIIGDIGGPNEQLGTWSISGGRPGENGQGVDWARDPTGQTLVGAGGGVGSMVPGGGGYVGVAGGGTPGASAAWQAQVRAMLLAQMQGLAGGVDENDPTIKAQMDAARLEGDRSQQQIRKALAERLAATGGVSASGSNELAQGVQQSLERQGSAMASLKGGLMSQELQAKRSQYAQLMNMALQTGDTESARELQLQIANMDNEIKRYSLQQQQGQFNDQYGLDVAAAAWQRDLASQRQKAGLDF